MAEVWEAVRDDRSQEPVAIKRLPVHGLHARAARHRLLDEAGVGASISHPNLVRTIEVVEDQEQVGIVMELLEGRTVSDLLDPSEPPPIGWTLGVSLQILAGLSAVHESKTAEGKHRGLIHRDLKPSNLFVTRQGVAKIIDFGIASLHGGERTLTSTGMFRGSLPYCSPEVVRHEPLDARTDLYSFGLVLYELLTGKRFHSQTSEAAILSSVLWSPIKPVRQIRVEAPEWLDALTGTLLQKDPTQRPASAKATCDVILANAQGAEVFGPAQIAAWASARPVVAAESAGTASGPAVHPLGGDTTKRDAPSALRGSPRAKPAAAAALVMLAVVGVAYGVLGSGATPAPAPPPPVVVPAEVAKAAPPVEELPTAPPAEPIPPPQAVAPRPKEQAKPTAKKTRSPRREGWLSVGVPGGWANVSVDGKLVGPTPLFRHALEEGRHTVLAVRRDGVRSEQVVQIEAGQERRVAIEWPATP